MIFENVLKQAVCMKNIYWLHICKYEKWKYKIAERHKNIIPLFWIQPETLDNLAFLVRKLILAGDFFF